MNVSAYFPPEVKSSLRLVQAKRGGKNTRSTGRGAEHAIYQIRGTGSCAHQSGPGRCLDASQTALFRSTKDCFDQEAL